MLKMLKNQHKHVLAAIGVLVYVRGVSNVGLGILALTLNVVWGFHLAAGSGPGGRAGGGGGGLAQGGGGGGAISPGPEPIVCCTFASFSTLPKNKQQHLWGARHGDCLLLLVQGVGQVFNILHVSTHGCCM